MQGNCYKCGFLLTFPSDTVGFKEECQKCHSDVHCCKACKFYDANSYNECKEPVADRIVDKEKSNFCDYYKFSGNHTANSNSKENTFNKLNDLFKR